MIEEPGRSHQEVVRKQVMGVHHLSSLLPTMTRTRPPNMRTCLLVALGALATCSNAFYLPGAAPRNYKLGDRVDLFVNALTPQENRDSAKVVRLVFMLSLR
jgi:hypothetical protein